MGECSTGQLGLESQDAYAYAYCNTPNRKLGDCSSNAIDGRGEFRGEVPGDLFRKYPSVSSPGSEHSRTDQAETAQDTQTFPTFQDRRADRDG